jgi:hypothetical protein
MALVQKIESRQKDIRTVHNTTTCTFSLYTNDAGDRFVQLDTYGSEDREVGGKVKQTLQFNEESAARLMEIFREVYPKLR